MGQVKLVGALLMTGLFAIALITFVAQFGVDNDVSFTLDDDLADTTSNIQTNLELYAGDINESSNQFSDSETTTGDSFASGSVFESGNINLMASVVPLLSVAYLQIFGSGSGFSIFFTTLAGFLVFLMVAYTYKTWIGRNPD